jgi:hypothetical protein
MTDEERGAAFLVRLIGSTYYMRGCWVLAESGEEREKIKDTSHERWHVYVQVHAACS